MSVSRAWTSATPGASRRLACTLYAAVSISGRPFTKPSRVVAPPIRMTPSPSGAGAAAARAAGLGGGPAVACARALTAKARPRTEAASDGATHRTGKSRIGRRYPVEGRRDEGRRTALHSRPHERLRRRAALDPPPATDAAGDGAVRDGLRQQRLARALT